MKTRTPRLTVVTVLFVVAALLMFIALRPGATSATAAVPAPAQACGAVGAYGYTAFGNTFAGNVLGFPAGVVSTNGIITLDASGHWFVRETEVINGAVVGNNATFNGEFAILSDCSFTASIQGTPIFVGVVVDRGNQVRGMSVAPGVQVNYVSTYKIRPAED